MHFKKKNQIKAPDCFKYTGEDSAYVFEPSSLYLQLKRTPCSVYV